MSVFSCVVGPNVFHTHLDCNAFLDTGEWMNDNREQSLYHQTDDGTPIPLPPSPISQADVISITFWMGRCLMMTISDVRAGFFHPCVFLSVSYYVSV